MCIELCCVCWRDREQQRGTESISEGRRATEGWHATEGQRATARDGAQHRDGAQQRDKEQHRGTSRNRGTARIKEGQRATEGLPAAQRGTPSSGAPPSRYASHAGHPEISVDPNFRVGTSSRSSRYWARLDSPRARVRCVRGLLGGRDALDSQPGRVYRGELTRPGTEQLQ